MDNFIIVDSGSSKSSWKYINGKIIKEFVIEGINPALQKHEDITFVLTKGFVNQETIFNAEKIFFYGAGCASEENCRKLELALRSIFPYAEIKIFSDLMAAAHALFNKSKGIPCILGTGSNSAYYNGSVLFKSVPSLGYVLGDEGSGAYIGKYFIRDLLYNNVPESLGNNYLEKFNLNKINLVAYFYSLKRPNVFLANTGGFISENNTNEYAWNLIEKSFTEFIEIHILPYLHFEKNLSLSFVGSIAFKNLEILSEALKKFDLAFTEVIQFPIERLLDFYCKHR